MDTLTGKRLAILSNVHRVHDGRVYYREARFAARNGMRVSILAIDDGCTSEEVAVHAFPAPKSRLRRFWLGCRLAYLAYRQGADIYHFHDPEMLPPMTLLKLVTRKPVIYDCHENVVDSIYYRDYIPPSLRPLVARLVYLVQWICVRLLGSVVLATKEQLEMFPSSTRHMVVRNFCPLSVYGSVSNDADRPYDLVHCGGWSPQRGCYVLIETLRILVQDYGRTDCRLLLIGVARDSLQPDVEKRILDYGLERQVEFRGVIPLHDVPRELARAKIGLMCHQATTQYRTGVATKLFDYMAAGLAIVGGYADCDREFAPEGTVKIYVDQTKPDEYAAAVNRLLNQPELRAQMGQNARRLFEERYTAEAQADALIQFYREHLPLPAAA